MRWCITWGDETDHRLCRGPAAGDRFVEVDDGREAVVLTVRENTLEGWYVGQPMEHPERNEWSSPPW
jgi:hypothetical protein